MCETVLLDLEWFHGLTTSEGWQIGKFTPINGYHLVYKIPLPETSDGQFPIVLPTAYRKKATKNVTMIRGFVLRASAPWHRKFKRRRIYWDQKTDGWKVKWAVWDDKQALPSDIPEGSGILYSSYNVGKVAVKNLPESLVVVREIDIEATFPIEESDRVRLGSKSMEYKISVEV